MDHITFFTFSHRFFPDDTKLLLIADSNNIRNLKCENVCWRSGPKRMIAYGWIYYTKSYTGYVSFILFK